jgi:hypothetical protein
MMTIWLRFRRAALFCGYPKKLGEGGSFPVTGPKSLKNPDKTTFFGSFPFCIPYIQKMCHSFNKAASRLLPNNPLIQIPVTWP